MDNARAAAPEIDRLVVSVYLTTREQHGLEVWDQAVAVGLDSIFLLNDVAEFLLTGRLTESWALRRFRYMAPEDVGNGLGSLHDGGHIILGDDGYRAAPRLAGFLEWLLSIRAEAAALQWAATPELVDEIEALLAPILKAFPRDVFPLGGGHRLLPDPAEPELRLHQHLTTLRFLRADAHGDAWAAEGLTASEAVALTTLWKAGAVSDGDPVARLGEAGWAMPNPWRITEAGIAVRDRIEVDTDLRNDTAFESFDPAEMSGLIELMRSLPGAVGG